MTEAQTLERPVMANGPEPFVGTEEVAGFIGKPASWVYNCAGTYGLPRYKIGRHFRYRLSEVAAWMEAQR